MPPVADGMVIGRVETYVRAEQLPPAKRTAARDSSWFSSNSSRMRASVSAVSRPSLYFMPVTSTIGRKYSSRGPLRRRSRLRRRTATWWRACGRFQQPQVASRELQIGPTSPGACDAPPLRLARARAGMAPVGRPTRRQRPSRPSHPTRPPAVAGAAPLEGRRPSESPCAIARSP